MIEIYVPGSSSKPFTFLYAAGETAFRFFLKEQKNQSQQAVEALQHENEQLKNEHRNWQEHIRSLLGKFDNV